MLEFLAYSEIVGVLLFGAMLADPISNFSEWPWHDIWGKLAQHGVNYSPHDCLLKASPAWLHRFQFELTQSSDVSLTVCCMIGKWPFAPSPTKGGGKSILALAYGYRPLPNGIQNCLYLKLLQVRLMANRCSALKFFQWWLNVGAQNCCFRVHWMLWKILIWFWKMWC